MANANELDSSKPRSSWYAEYDPSVLSSLRLTQILLTAILFGVVALIAVVIYDIKYTKDVDVKLSELCQARNLRMEQGGVLCTFWLIPPPVTPPPPDAGSAQPGAR